MAIFYIQLENRLLQISGELTAENISKALGYVPVSPNVTNELSQRVDNITFDSLKDNPFLQDGSGELNIVDEAGNIIAKIDADGIHSVDFIAGEHRLTEKADKADVPTKLSELKNDKEYITKSEVPDPDFFSLQGNPFAEDDSGNFTVVDENGNIGMQLNQGVLVVKDVIAGNDVLSNKVDKIKGKGLSTEDFTTTLKERLLSLSNFDSTEIEASIGRLQQQIDTLVNGNASEAIDTFNEIIAFLEGVEDTESLSGIIASIEQQIANIRIPVNISELNNDEGYATEKYVDEKSKNIDFDDLQNNPLSDDENGELNIIDESGNVGMKVSSEAVYAKDFVAGEHKLSEKVDKTYVDDAIKNNGVNIDLSDYETKAEAQAKLQEAKDYTDTKIAELQEGVVTQIIELNKGYNWVSFYVKTSLQDLQSALGNKATLIGTSDNGTSTINIKTEYNAENNTWSGNLIELNYTSMYQIHCSEACSIEVKGAKLNPSELEYTIVPGTTWISYPLDKELSIAEAIVGLSSAEGDQLKSHNSAAQYYNEYGWYAFDLQPMIPGKGYMYVNTTNETKTFYFPSNEEENSDFETKEDALAKLQEAKSYTDIQIQDLKDEVVEQAFEFGEAGTYWISFYIKTSLEELCNALGSNGTKISTSTDDTGSENLVLEYNTETGSWSGSLTEIDPLRMYMVTVSAPCTISLKGKKLDTEKSAITLNPGWNWIGYPSDKEISLSEAFVHLNARLNDQLKAQSDTATYYGSSMGWYGGVGTLIPGQGYMYKNNSKEIKTLVFSTGEPNYIYETKIDAQVKLEEAKEYTDSRISEIKERVVSQTIELNAGWNWVSFYIDIELVDLQNALGSNGSQIKDYTGKTTTYMSGYGLWSPGGLSTISHHVMYMIQVKESCSITLEGKKLDPDKIDMLISSNTTSWISYPLSVAAELDKALVNVPVVAGDVIKSRDGESEYIDGYGWEGDLTIMEPGKGYQYISNSAESYNFKYPSLEVDVEAELAKKQDTLISGENIKTINGTSILGNGDIVIKSPDMSNYAEKEYVDNKTDELRDIVTQTLSLTSGTIWCSFYVDITLEQLQQALGTNATTITTSFDGNTEVTSSYDADTNTWSGDLTTLDVTKMYMIAVNTDCEISLTGRKIPNSTSYTLNPGWNWIGYPVNEEINVTDALANLDPKTGDIIKSQNRAAYCTGTSWKVEIGWDRMIPGQGYKYNNTSESVKNLIYTIKSIDVKSELSKKQNTLVSGTNIKTVNGESLLGEGNIAIPQIVYVPNEASMPDPPVEGVLYLIGNEET